MSLPRSTPRVRDCRGFALLITITLLAFLVLLLVSLASLTRVETRVAANNQQLAQARQNALFALNVAIGQLQKYAGPDQRVTARADLFDATTPNGTAANGLVSPNNGTRYWTGVWGNSDSPVNIYTATPKPVLLNWLVSGNENLSVNFDPSTGKINTSAATTTAYHPDQTVDGLAAGVTVLGNFTLTAGGQPQPATLLVGPGTLGSDINTYVVVPLVPMNVSTASMPGLDATAAPATSVGRYAYWVGDEGVKAKYNLRDPHSANTYSDPNGYTETETNGRYRFLSTGRNGIELMTGQAQYPVNNGSLDKVINGSQLPFADSSTVAQAHYHDLTTHSAGILSDSQRGGLRKDLTYYFEQPALPAPLAGNPVLPGGPADANDPLPVSVNPAKGIKWDLLKSYYNLAQEARTGAVNLRVAGDTQMGVTPVLLQNRMGFYLDTDSSGHCTIWTKVVFVVGNPYNVTLNAPDGVNFYYSLPPYETQFWGVEFWLFGTAGSSYNTYQFSYHGGGTTNPYYPILKSPATQNDGQASVLDRIGFKTPAFSIAPGETKAFTLQSTDQNPLPPASPDPNTRTLVQLAEGAYPGYIKHDTNYTIPGYPPAGLYSRTLLLKDPRNYNLTMCLGSGNEILQTQTNIDPLSQATTVYITAKTGPKFFQGYEFWPVLPGDNQTITGLGSSSASYRAYADFNLRGTMAATPPFSPLWQQSGNTQKRGMAQGGPFAGKFIGNSQESELTVDLAPAAWGRHYLDNGVGQEKVVLFDIPRRDGPDDIPLLSLGQLQHASVTADDEYLAPVYQPGYAIGNSWFSAFVARDKSIDSRRAYTTATTLVSDATQKANIYDISYLYNAALWDHYFLSSIPQGGSGSTFQLAASTSATQLPNGRLKIAAGTSPTLTDLRSGTEAARHLLVDGAFNINSTSVQAWAAILSGLRNLTLPNDPATTGVPYPRTLRQPFGSQDSQTGNVETSYNGIRRLTDNDIYNSAANTGLAVDIVKQIRARGPFLSLAHFINRKLSTKTDPLSAAGALQSAITNANLNASPDGNATYLYTGYAYADNSTDATGLGSRSMASPGWLTQGDVLQALGANLSARSDTFLIRTYGETLDPVNSTSNNPIVTGKAWCEAVIQRLPEYVDNAQSATLAPSSANITNQTFGRKFRVVSFRWLTSNDI